jgi:hypothetical protein
MPQSKRINEEHSQSRFSEYKKQCLGNSKRPLCALCVSLAASALNFIPSIFKRNEGMGEHACLANKKKGAYEGFVVVKDNFSSAYSVHS